MCTTTRILCSRTENTCVSKVSSPPVSQGEHEGWSGSATGSCRYAGLPASVYGVLGIIEVMRYCDECVDPVGGGAVLALHRSLCLLHVLSSHLWTLVSPSAPVCSTEKATLVETRCFGPSNKKGGVRVVHRWDGAYAPRGLCCQATCQTVLLDVSRDFVTLRLPTPVWFGLMYLDITCDEIRIGCAYLMSWRFPPPSPGLILPRTGTPSWISLRRVVFPHPN